jgi:uncharacterized protein (DUF427 family)
MWQHTGQQRPEFAREPGPGQESVWDYPRPPALVDATARVTVRAGQTLIAQSQAAKRVLETASPPTYYVPPAAVRDGTLIEVPGMQTWCEWKGAATYWALASDPAAGAVGWSYATPTPAFSAIRDWLCFYPDRVDCYVGDEQVRAQSGGFYGGWVTDSIVGPYKGEPGSGHW